MNNDVFGEVSFDFGFTTHVVISIFGKAETVEVDAQAYYESDGITTSQEQAYAFFKEHLSKSITQAEQGLLEQYPEAEERFSLITILVNRDGRLALLFDDSENEDEGIAVQLLPDFEIESQDVYL